MASRTLWSRLLGSLLVGVALCGCGLDLGTLPTPTPLDNGQPSSGGSNAASGSESTSGSASDPPASGSTDPRSSGQAASGQEQASGASSGGGQLGSESGASGSPSGSGQSDASGSPISASGNAQSGAASGAASGQTTSGASSGTPVSSGPCKRGIASNQAPSTALAHTASSPGVWWWYNWAVNAPSGGDAAVEFDPMFGAAGALGSKLPTGAKFLLGFNEPDFKAQSDLSPQQAAADWPTLQAKAKAAGIPLVSPGVNFCGSASNTSQCTTPSITDPYTWLKDFFDACTGCEVDYVAVHWYNCDLPSLQSYIDGGGSAGFPGFVQFGKPIWVTEFSCDSTQSVANQTAYMKAAIPYLENNPNVYRYSWFSASPIPNAELMNSDGSLTALGQTYVSLPASCE